MTPTKPWDVSAGELRQLTMDLAGIEAIEDLGTVTRAALRWRPSRVHGSQLDRDTSSRRWIMRADHAEQFRRLTEADQQLAQWKAEAFADGKKNGHERQSSLAAAFVRFLREADDALVSHGRPWV